MEKRNLKIDYTESNDEKNDKNLYTFVLPNNDYMKDLEIEDKEKEKKEESKDNE